MKTFKQFINENLNNELTTEDLEMMMDKDGNLNLHNQKLTKLPLLPNGLRTLWCSNNNLTELPPLPKGLKELYCNHNNLVELPPLHNGLKELYCNNNKLVELSSLPKGLKELYCNHNNLVELPPLPKGLKELSCSNNQLSTLPLLPDGLIKLYCRKNPDITKYNLPFPSTLQELLCDNLYGFSDIYGYKEWLEKQQWRKDNPDLATLDDIGLL